jgi:3-oxocholest-4-en-26-oate---CoA ligase
VVFHSSLGARIEAARKRSPDVKLWVEVDDGGPHLEGAERYEDLISSHSAAPRIAREPEDRYLLYTGGTTGMPKGVEYEVGTLAATFLAQRPPLFGLDPVARAEDAPATARRLADEGNVDIALPACPLMHGTGNWAGLMGPHVMGGTSVLLESRTLDAEELWSAVERERVASVVIVGEAFARPLLRALEHTSFDLSRFRVLVSSGAMFAAETKSALLDHVPHLAIIDSIGASEGVMGMDITVKGVPAETARFGLLPTTKVLTEDGREVAPGSGETGFVAVSAGVPVGYYKDPVKSAATFREFGGVRYSIPGDLATVREDGTIQLLGRGNNCINTGGEKVFPEEVEEAVKTHPAIDDCLVLGVPDEQFGQRVVAVASLAPGASASADEIVEHTKARLAGYKAPRAVVFVDRVPRTPSGKADYPAARRNFEEA